MRESVILYNPWSTPSAKKPLPMSLLATASQLDDVADWEIVDGNLEADPVARILSLAESRRPTAIGITVMPGPQLGRAVPDSRRLKAALPDVPIVWGGYFPSLHADTVLADPAVDSCVVGQGEQAFPELVRRLGEGGDLADVPGLVWKDGGSPRHNPRGPLLDVGELPDWPYDRVPMERYIHRHYLGERVGTHHSSYGCPFGCSFCAV
ncbi:MAG: cobalamin-dependent protein, partial [Thermoanaerobaculia bacterium]|nr:cobalamin-dependent protein [Thermoanaerobaculia bacterium]